MAQVKTPRLLEHVAHPLVRFTPASSTTALPGQWSETTYWVRLTLFGFIPFGKQAVRITFREQPDRFQVRDNGYSRLIRRWDHWVTIEPSGDGCHYEDCIDVEAGVLTPVNLALRTHLLRASTGTLAKARRVRLSVSRRLSRSLPGFAASVERLKSTGMTSFNYTQPPTIPVDAFVAPLKKPTGLSADWVEPAQRVFSSGEHQIWRELFERQSTIAAGRACDAHQRGLELLGITAEEIPELAALNERLLARSGWQAVPVPMLIPDHIFLYHLANRRFPIGNFLRTRAQFDYIEEPDVFHDCYGHIPLLADPVFAEYMQAFGKAGWKALQYNRVAALSTLYWFTVEFGLIGPREGELRAYGAGILSSPQELVFSLEGRSPNRVHLALERVMRTDYHISDLQQTYFVVESFDQLYRHTQGREFEEVYETLPPAPIYANSAVLETDRTYHRGTQEYRLRGGRLSRATPC